MSTPTRPTWTTVAERTRALELPRQRPPGGYGLSIGRLVDDYPDFTICADELGYTARMRSADGSGHVGGHLKSVALDGLADQMDIKRALVIDTAALPGREPGASGAAPPGQ